MSGKATMRVYSAHVLDQVYMQARVLAAGQTPAQTRQPETVRG